MTCRCLQLLLSYHSTLSSRVGKRETGTHLPLHNFSLGEKHFKGYIIELETCKPSLDVVALVEQGCSVLQAEQLPVAVVQQQPQLEHQLQLAWHSR